MSSKFEIVFTLWTLFKLCLNLFNLFQHFHFFKPKIVKSIFNLDLNWTFEPFKIFEPVYSWPFVFWLFQSSLNDCLRLLTCLFFYPFSKSLKSFQPLKQYLQRKHKLKKRIVNKVEWTIWLNLDPVKNEYYWKGSLNFFVNLWLHSLFNTCIIFFRFF